MRLKPTTPGKKDPKPSSAKGVGNDLPFDFLSIDELPDSSSEINAIGQRLDKVLTNSFLSRVPESEWTNARLDDFIFECIHEYGALALLSHRVIRRVLDWRFAPKGISKLEKLGRELAQAARIRRRLAKGSVGFRHVAAKENMVSELKRLQRALQNEWPETAESSIAFIRRTIGDHEVYPMLYTNKHALCDDFLHKYPTKALAFRGSDRIEMTAVQFFHEWLAHSENRTPESVRQDLSRIGRSNRRG